MKKTILAIIFLALPLSFTVLAQFTPQSTVALEITADASGVIPIGVVMFQPMEGSPVAQTAQPWRVIAENLMFTGDFSVTRLNTADSASLAENNLPVYISGQYYIEDDSMTIEIFLRESTNHGALIGQTSKFHKSNARAFAHRFSSQVHRTLFGVNGPYETQILFVENPAEGLKNIVVSDFDGHNRRRLTNGGINILPSFMGRQNILYISFERGKPDIFSLNLHDGTRAAVVASRRVESSPQFSEITGRIAYASSKGGNMEIYTAERSGANPQQLTVNAPAISTSPRWAPNGHSIAFVSDRSGNPQIYIMDRTGANVRRLTFAGSHHDSPAWSPDGLKIAYTARRGGRNIIAMSATDGRQEEVLLTLGVDGAHEYPSWSPDGSHIVFSHSRGNRRDISAIRISDGRVITLTTCGTAEQPNWSGF